MREKNLLGIPLVVLLLSFLSLSLWAETLVEFDFSKEEELNKWVFLEPEGVELEKSNPPEYGPGVLVMTTAGHAVGFVKDFKFTDGIIEVLWRDANLPEDADGPLAARSATTDNADDAYTMELDTDTGFHITIFVAAAPQTLVVSDRRMSDGKWTWMKWRFEGKNQKAKNFKADQKEPEEWEIELDDETFKEGYVGFSIWSGTAEIAFYRVTDLDGPSAVRLKEKLSTTWGRIKSF